MEVSLCAWKQWKNEGKKIENKVHFNLVVFSAIILCF